METDLQQQYQQLKAEYERLQGGMKTVYDQLQDLEKRILANR